MFSMEANRINLIAFYRNFNLNMVQNYVVTYDVLNPSPFKYNKGCSSYINKCKHFCHVVFQSRLSAKGIPTQGKEALSLEKNNSYFHMFEEKQEKNSDICLNRVLPINQFIQQNQSATRGVIYPKKCVSFLLKGELCSNVRSNK